MKFLFAMNLPYHPAVGGANKANRLLAGMLARKGHSVTAVVPALGTPARLTHRQFIDQLEERYARIASGPGVDVFNIDDVEVHAVEQASQLRQHLIELTYRLKPDCTIVSTEDPSHSLLDAAVKTNPERVVCIVHTPSFLPFGPQAFFPSSLRTKLFEQGIVLVAVSEFVKEYILRWGGLESTRIYLPVYGEGPFPSLGHYDNKFVTIVNPCTVKGIEIFKDLAQASPEIEFAFVPSWGTTEQDQVSLKKLSNVHLLPARTDFDEILKQTRVLLLPSLWEEAFGLTVVEAMLRGVPVMASDVGGVAEAKLGTDFLLPVSPISSFSENLDQNRIPIASLPEQDIEPWRTGLVELLSQREVYKQQAIAAQAASSRFVANLGIEPLEDLLIDV
ncbi:MAG TPA: glycosyltransferase, partial [Pyrinomonadaceae bacterium]